MTQQIRERAGWLRSLMQLPRRNQQQSTDPDAGARHKGRHPPRGFNIGGRFGSALVLIALSTSLIVSSVGLDGFLNRGIVYGTPTVNGGGFSMGMNVFLEKEAERQNIVRSVQMLKAGGVTFVRQSFPWQDIERAPGYYRDRCRDRYPGACRYDPTMGATANRQCQSLRQRPAAGFQQLCQLRRHDGGAL